MAHVNSTEVQTAEGTVTVTKTSTHRDYVAASIIQYTDGTQVVLSWHLTGEAGLRYIGSKAARDILAYNSEKWGKEGTLTLLPVTVTLTGKDVPVQGRSRGPGRGTETLEAVTGSGVCYCGCGVIVRTMGKSRYLPGHDAKHVSVIANLIRRGAASTAEAREVLSPALYAKLLRQKGI